MSSSPNDIRPSGKISDRFEYAGTDKLQKLQIGSLDEPTKGIEAQYNPRELSVDKSVPWSKHKDSKGDQPHLEFTGADGRSLGLELTFDGFEKKASVQAQVDALLELAKVRDANASDEDHKRPHKVAVVFGRGSGNLPAFVGVIESVSTKYTMFLPDGTPVRATCTVKVKEADKLSFKKGT
ncbi:MAG TPA: hypothetical protein VL463_25380 [Kofleriaceae bacterium]|jgi:hypothetical protein|nr:hypothetical protein [Kofleriaceae bacterium]